MEKENLDNFLENRQNFMMDNNSMQQLNVAGAGDQVVGGIQAEVVSGVAGEILGGKYDEQHEEHDVGDDDELKYVEEVQQSEKQQQQQLQTLKNFGLDDDGTYKSNELAEKETSYNAANEFGNGNGGFVFGGDHQNHKQQPHHDLFNMGNGHDSNGHDSANINQGFGNIISTGFEEKLDMMESDLDGFKNEGDFSSTSNVTEFAEGFVPQIDVEIETKVEHQEIIDEEESSSLATNTTNGTSSLSENVPPQAVVDAADNPFGNFMASLVDKENSDPITPERPNDLDLDQSQSQLNPDAKEFIPSFGSNPASPTSPFATGVPQNEPVVGDILETEMYFGQAPSAVPRHLLVDDDLVAQSPRKGKCENTMDAVSLPRELAEFEQEADKRPHDLEPEGIEGFNQRDEVMTPDQAIQQLPLDDIVTQDKENQPPADSTDFHPSNSMDHGPETCVDPEADFNLQPTAVLSSVENEDDVMKRSMYVASDDAIEDVLNSVQPIPTEIDSVNNSFIEESATESAVNQLAGDKELLQVEEKEHVSHSPSTEEIQMNLQNTLNSSNKDIPQLPIDMDNSDNMQESMYMEQEQIIKQDHKHNNPFQVETPFDQEDQRQLQADEHRQQEQLFGETHQQNYQHESSPLENNQPLVFHEKIEIHNETQSFQEEFQCKNKTEEQLSDAGEETHELEQVQSGKEPEEQQSNIEEEKLVKHPIQTYEEQELLEEPPLDNHELHHDQQLTQDPMAGTLPIELTKENLLDDATNSLIAHDSFLDNNLATQEPQHEINESLSPLKITDEVSNTHVIESLIYNTPENQQEVNLNGDVMTSSFTADEKHLLEETKEQQLFSVSGLEQQMTEMMLNETDDHLLQAEEVATTIAIAAIEDISEDQIIPDEAIAHEEIYQQHQERHETLEQMLVDDSFNRHEQECLQQYQQEQQREQQHEQHMDIETETKFDLVKESIESPIEQHHQQELERELVAVEEPVMEAAQAVPLFTNEETEIVNVIKTDERQELLPCMTPETAPAELLEPPMSTRNETENIERQDDQYHQTTEDVKAETVLDPEVEELKEKEAVAVKEDVAVTSEISADIPVEAAIVAAVAAGASTAAVGVVLASSESKNKTETEKKPLPKAAATTAKSKVAPTTAAKKPVDAAKKPVGLAAKPRAVPAKPAGNITDKKPIGKTATTTTTAARKPLSATTASKVVAKTTTTTSTPRTTIAASKTTATSKPTTAPRTVPSSTTAARKPATTNGPLAKPRPTTAPAKPTTLGLPATNGAPKTKPTSPRSTLISQVRKTTPATSAAKSPVKSTATNGVSKMASSTLASRTKTTTTTVSSSAGTATKTFTARPAPKFTSSSSTTTTVTTTKRLSAAASTISSSATTTAKASSAPLRKSTPTKPAAGRTPTKAATTSGGSKSKTPITKTASPETKPAPIRKPVVNTAAAAAVVTNGQANINKELNGSAEEQHQQASQQNGDLQAVELQQQNGNSGIPMQTEKHQQSFLESRDEQIPMDLINA